MISATTIATRQAALLEKMASVLYIMTVASKTNSTLTPELESAEILLKEMDDLDKLKKEAILDALWNGVKALNRAPENDFESHYKLEIQIIGGVKAWRMITGDDLKTSAEAVKAIREEIYNGTIKFPFI